MKKDAYYFPHFSNARTDRRLKRVRKQLGIEGYGIYFMVLETLREQTDFKYPVEDIDLLADEFGTSEEKARAVVMNFSLFEVDENEDFFSPKMLEYLEPYLENKERKRIGGIKGNLLRYNKITREQLDNMTDEEIIEYDKNAKTRSFSHTESDTDHSSSQSKVNKSKVNKSKVNESKVKEKKVNKSKVNDIVARELAFKQSLKDFSEKYDRDMLIAFANHWTEPNRSKTKMKFEMERTWDLGRRLSKWDNNSFSTPFNSHKQLLAPTTNNTPTFDHAKQRKAELEALERINGK